MKHILSLCLVLVLTLTALAADPSDDEKNLAGSWAPTKAELGGQALPEVVLKTISLKLAGGKYEALVGGNTDRGTYTLDATKKPKQMTITGTVGPNKDKTFPAIYELAGDTLRVCYDLSGAKHPAEFKTAAGTQLYLVTYIRQPE